MNKSCGKEPDFIVAPFQVVVDTREQTPWGFRSLWVSLKDAKVPLVIHTVSEKLDTGDYSIVGFEDKLTIERKSFDDALNTFIHGRERFERELERMKEYEFAVVMMEFPEHKLKRQIPGRNINPQSVIESIRAWRQRYGVHFIFGGNAFFAEIEAVKEFRRWWIDKRNEKVSWNVTD